jgi:O-methyltransferase involved in polyketide biosynthesis
MENVNKTLYIPLFGKAYVSEKGILLQDPKAEEIWAAEGFPLKGKSASKWLAYHMGMRAAVFDNWVKAQLAQWPDAVVLHIGCGMDGRCLRIGTQGQTWYDIDFPEVIRERKRYFPETDGYRMIASDMRTEVWKQQIPAERRAIVVMEGVSMYLRPEELENLLKTLRGYFGEIRLLMDVYSTFGAKVSKYKNPINDVGVTTVYGMDEPAGLAENTGLQYVKEHAMTPLSMIAQLSPSERVIFTNLFAGSFARKIYRIYEFA